MPSRYNIPVRLVITEENWRKFLPLTWMRPLWDLRLGAMTLRERTERFWKTRAWLLPARDWLSLTPEIPEGEFILSRADFLPLEPAPDLGPGSALFSHEGEPIAVMTSAARLREGLFALAEGAREKFSIKAEVVGRFWNLVHMNRAALLFDMRDTEPVARGRVETGATLLGRVSVEDGARIYPGVVVDAEDGPVFIGKGSVLMPNAFIQGPAFIGENCLIKAGSRIYGGTTLGPVCKVGGEVSETIIQGYSNKQHEGFLGHAYLGEWVNIGAGTEVSDLKNTYGTIRVWLDGEMNDTGLMFLGPTIGDHAKTGINTTITTGAVIGVFANLVGSGVSPKFVPSFSWGYPEFSEYRLEEAIEVARRVMARRGVEMTPGYENTVKKVFELTKPERNA
jgi:UDP-N-acetylglucosamine diphosphorylase/glucosamine-1-phosphate N-acetyltransferase